MVCCVSCNRSSDSNNEGKAFSTLKEEVKKSGSSIARGDETGKPIVIDFYATWCGPCKRIEPLYEMLKSEYSDRIDFKSVDVDEDLEMTARYKIEAMPTFVILDKTGKEINRIVGADHEALSKAIDALVRN